MVPRVAVGNGPSASILSTDMSVSGSVPSTRARTSRPTCRMSRTALASATTWALVRTWPSLRKMTPEPTEPPPVSRRTRTTDALAPAITSTMPAFSVTAAAGRGTIWRSMGRNAGSPSISPIATTTRPVAKRPALTADTAATTHNDGRAGSEAVGTPTSEGCRQRRSS